MKFGVTSVSLPTLDLEGAAKAVAEAGFAGIEWRVQPKAGSIPDVVPAHPYLVGNRATLELSLESAHHARQAAAAADLAVIGLGAYIEPGDDSTLQQVLHMARESQAPQVRIQTPRMARTNKTYGELFQTTRSFLEVAEERALESGVQVLVEIHHNTICPSASLTHRMVDGFDPAAVGVIYDVGNMVFEGYEDHRIGLELLGPYIRHVHVKNAAHRRGANGRWRPTWVPLDDGLIDIPAVLQIIENSGYDGWYAIEDLSLDRDPEQTLRYNADVLTGWGLL